MKYDEIIRDEIRETLLKGVEWIYNKQGQPGEFSQVEWYAAMKYLHIDERLTGKQIAEYYLASNKTDPNEFLLFYEQQKTLEMKPPPKQLPTMAKIYEATWRDVFYNDLLRNRSKRPVKQIYQVLRQLHRLKRYAENPEKFMETRLKFNKTKQLQRELK